MHNYISALLTLCVNLVFLGVVFGTLNTKVKGNTKDIEALKADLAGRMNRETMELRFEALSRQLDLIQSRLSGLEKAIAAAGCEYPKCVLGQVFTSTGATPVDVVSALAAIKKRAAELPRID